MTKVKSVNTVSVKDVLGADVLASGTLTGRRVLCRLIERLADLEPGPLFLDFSSVPTGTASFLREAVLAFRSYVLQFAPGLYPVVANASEAILNDIETVLEHRKDALVACRLVDRRIVDVRVLGPLDPGLARALHCVRLRVGVTAGELAKASKEEISAAAWHNRLTILSRRGLVIADGGKPARYRFVLDSP